MEIQELNGKTNAALTTGIIGTALGALNGGMGLLGTNIGSTGYNQNIAGHQFVTKDELDYVQAIAAKDSEIALLKSEQNTEVKIADVYERVMNKILANERDQAKINSEQAVFNGVNTATLNCMQNNIAQLMSLTALRIPNSSVCPGWGQVTVTPGNGTTVG